MAFFCLFRLSFLLKIYVRAIGTATVRNAITTATAFRPWIVDKPLDELALAKKMAPLGSAKAGDAFFFYHGLKAVATDGCVHNIISFKWRLCLIQTNGKQNKNSIRELFHQLENDIVF